MVKSIGLANLGPIMQLAWLPEDFDAAVQHWTQTMGVGPFFLLENIALQDMTYRGEPSEAVFSLALAYWGDVQVELIRNENDAPSIYNGEHGVRDRLHHVCLLSDDIAAARQTCLERGAQVLLEAKVGEDGAVIYVDPRPGEAGHLVEILKPQSGTLEVFAMMREAARNWDGSDPVRRLG